MFNIEGVNNAPVKNNFISIPPNIPLVRIVVIDTSFSQCDFGLKKYPPLHPIIIHLNLLVHYSFYHFHHACSFLV